jgi:hypothetical protein
VLSSKIKQEVASRANNLCEYCLANSEYAFHSFPIDHILPISLKGKNVINNLAYSCQFCNNSKYNKTHCLDPLTNERVRLFNPRKDKWLNHFMWNVNKTTIIGISPIGRATVYCLKVNRSEAINLRKVLAAYGVHPPF